MNLTVNDRTYWVEDEGSGPPLLFLHGFTGSTNIWEEVKGHLPGFRMIRVDLPGHGKTGDIGVLSMEEVACDLKAMLQELNIERLSVAGYSMGGRTALFFASMYPDMVDRLILESASPGLRTVEERKERIRKDRNVIDLLENHGIEAFTDKWEELPLFESIKELPASRRHSLRKERLANDGSGLIASLEGMGTGVQPSLWDDLKTLDKPVCLIAGEKDAKYKKLNEEMAEIFPQAQLHLVKNAGHIPHLEKPDIFSEIVRQFMI
ncbi:2-succinyl-6-hydroxy-2,4-cyclohexadiene-1-carboxylate synthase [Salimicrobium halophilum]|uniref:Putative 2-succinyl-6-hydroxy-2,4-cyclohexadiene-1-carboxylate synthase n=1 Tax=Salimicrobium halophilum TaxID=86666 RepID=A0A1G8VBF8_9BACI|nr:2-succinyl-6-hydroxy-2,4-cyclohexadiene-1-carboxylate synthase [Salimicrobium halophilum]SDJ63411.1 2-succinyl-6-hydroxy-2,4-cyclohexadiene-1-carboxylate synthase [Salimicrobium halophilum]